MRTLVTTLAIARLTSLVTEDEITRPVREAVQRWASDAPEFSLPERAATLLSCGRCMSVYAAGAVLIAVKVPALRPLVWVLAGSQAALLLLAVEGKIER